MLSLRQKKYNCLSTLFSFCLSRYIFNIIKVIYICITKHQIYIYIFIWLVPETCPRSFPQTGDTIIKSFEDENESPSVMSNSLWPHGLYSPWNSPGQNTGVGSLSLLQGIFPTQGLNPGLPHCRQILYQLSHQGSPQLLEWIAYPFSRGICQTQKLKWGLIHCRRILYQLSHQGYIPDKNTPEPWQ